jgi:hypothetical protein
MIVSGGGRTRANAYHLNFETLTPQTGFRAYSYCVESLPVIRQ